MTETKLTKEPRSPYELWPDEPSPFESIPQEPVSDPVGDPTVSESFISPESEVRFDAPFEATFIPVAYTPDTTEQTVRNSGLAWSAGIVFFAAVAFMLFLGWIADLLLGSTPFGIVIGIVLGSIIGFIQFFRISSQMFSSQKPDPDHRPLLSRHEDED